MTVQTPLSLDDYDAIASAVMETERGRWFLAEFARRNRAADTDAVLTALGDLERALAGRRYETSGPSPDAERTANLLRRVAERAALVRNELHRARSADTHARIARAQTHLDKLDRLIALALSTTGVQPAETDAALRRRAEAALALPGRQALIPAELHERRQDDAADQPEPATDLAATEEPADAAVAPDERTVFVNGHAIDILAEEEAAQEPLAAEPSDAPPAPDLGAVEEADRRETGARAEEAAPRDEKTDERPLRMPPAVTPLLLDDLSPEAKAILFA